MVSMTISCWGSLYYPLLGACHTDRSDLSICQNDQRAQTYVTPLMIVVMLIGITSMFGSGARSQIYYYLIPIYNSVQSMVGIFSFHVHGSLILTTIASNLVVTAIGAACLAKMFDSEYIMFHK